MPCGDDSKRYPPKGFTGHDGRWPDDDDIDLWRATRGYHNIALRLPHGVVGIDVDAYTPKLGGKTLDQLTSQLGPWTGPDQPFPIRSTSRQDNTSGIYLFRAVAPNGRKWRGRLGTDIEMVHFGHRYVMAAPSRHPKSGNPYRWLDEHGNQTKLPSPEQLPLLAEPWIELACKEDFEDDRTGGAPRLVPKFTDEQLGTRYGISGLERELSSLQSEWDRGDGGFNDQLNRCAFCVGQLVAGGELNEEKARAALLEKLAELGAPVDQYKTVDSGMTSGLAQPRSAPEIVPPKGLKLHRLPPDTPPAPHVPRGSNPAGGLVGTGTTIEYRKVEVGLVSKAPEVTMLQWSDFDIRATGRCVDDDGELQAYSVVLTRDRDGAEFDTILSVDTLNDPKRLTKWLMFKECAVLLTSVASPAWNVRLGVYLASHQAPVARIVPHLGWDDESESFVTFDGVITPDGLHPFDSVRPNPDLRRKSVRFNYGFEADEATAVDVLREVLTFHDPTVCSVYGAWWASCLLKGQIMRRTSLFPAMGIEASSESGKTSGFFPMMVALAGNQRGHSNDTVAAFRDQVAGHRNGIAWQDDLDDTRRMFELIRSATSEGTLGKKGEDNNASVDAWLVAPIMVSGEGLDMSNQKAMNDRVVMLHVPSPKGRKSLHDQSREQWDDIVSLRDRWPDLTVLSGHLVTLALRHADLVEGFGSLRSGSGRHADKMAILRLGARVLAKITGDDQHIRRVDDWVSSREDIGAENAMTLQMVPAFLRLVGAREEPRRFEMQPYHAVPFPVLIRNDSGGQTAVWVNTDLLAQWWEKENKGRVEVRTQTAQALRQQAADLSMRGEKSGVSGVDYLRLRVYEGAAEAANRNERRTWQRLPDFVCARLLEEFEEYDPSQEQNVTRIAGRNQLTDDTAKRVERARHRPRR